MSIESTSQWTEKYFNKRGVILTKNNSDQLFFIMIDGEKVSIQIEDGHIHASFDEVTHRFSMGKWHCRQDSSIVESITNMVQSRKKIIAFHRRIREFKNTYEQKLMSHETVGFLKTEMIHDGSPRDVSLMEKGLLKIRLSIDIVPTADQFDDLLSCLEASQIFKQRLIKQILES